MNPNNKSFIQNKYTPVMKQKTSFIILICIVLLTSACSKKNEYKITGSLKGMGPNGRALLLDPVTF